MSRRYPADTVRIQIWSNRTEEGASLIRNLRRSAPLAYPLVGLIVAVVGMSCSTGGDASLAAPEPEVASTSTPFPTLSPIVFDIPARTPEATPKTLKILALDVLAPDAIPYLEGRSGRIGVAVVVPKWGVAYAYNGDVDFPMASVAKVPIMLTVLHQADEAGRGLNDDEEELLREMITVSDNIDAYALWDAIGGAGEVAEYLGSIGIEGIVLNSQYWGESLAPAVDVAETLAMLAQGAILSESSTAVALDLLEGVDEAQDWGVPSGPLTDKDVIAVGVKNGWYPAPNGWRVNSVGYVLSEDSELEYAIAVLSDEQSSLAYGIQTIEGLSQMLHPLLVD